MKHVPDRSNAPGPSDPNTRHHVTGRAAELQHLGLVGLSLIHEMSTPILAAQLSLESLILDLEEGRALDTAMLVQRLRKAMNRHRTLSEHLNRYRRWLKNDTAELTEVSVADILDHVVGLVRPGLDIKGLPVPTLTDATESAADLIVADRIWLEQILTGLILNASQAAHSRGADGLVELDVACEGDSVCLSVRDNGPGFEEAAHAEGTSTVPDGLGVGLRLARRLAATMGASLSFAQAHPNGTVVRLCVPRAAERP